MGGLPYITGLPQLYIQILTMPSFFLKEVFSRVVALQISKFRSLSLSKRQGGSKQKDPSTFLRVRNYDTFKSKGYKKANE
jgi:hypothetical protein